METVDKILAILNEFQEKRTFSENYEDVFLYAEKYGGVTSKAFQKHLKELLQDGYIPFDEAEEIIQPVLRKLSEDIGTVTAGVQQTLNNASGVGMKALQAPINEDKISGIVNKLTSDVFENTSWILGEPIINFAQAVVGDTQKANMDFQAKAGLKPRIERRVVNGCCEWCTKIAGTYIYPDVPKDIYRRHENCRCVTEYIGNGKTKNVWTKK